MTAPGLLDWQLLQRVAPNRLVIEDVQPEAEDVERSDRVIVCAACRHPITTERQRIRVDGAHEHDFVNPAGFLFHIGCFRDASGCTTWGAPTLEFTWFAAHAWRYALCRGCRAHLGWRFEGVQSGFFGLVLNRLATEVERSQ